MPEVEGLKIIVSRYLSKNIILLSNNNKNNVYLIITIELLVLSLINKGISMYS